MAGIDLDACFRGKTRLKQQRENGVTTAIRRQRVMGGLLFMSHEENSRDIVCVHSLDISGLKVFVERIASLDRGERFLARPIVSSTTHASFRTQIIWHTPSPFL